MQKEYLKYHKTFDKIGKCDIINTEIRSHKSGRQCDN